MDVDVARELLNELSSSLEKLETQHAALLQFLKDEGIVTEERLAAYLTQAGKASDVRWRAARVRLEGLISSGERKEERRAEKEQQAGTKQSPIQNGGNEAASKNDEAGKNDVGN